MHDLSKFPSLQNRHKFRMALRLLSQMKPLSRVFTAPAARPMSSGGDDCKPYEIQSKPSKEAKQTDLTEIQGGGCKTLQKKKGVNKTDEARKMKPKPKQRTCEELILKHAGVPKSNSHDELTAIKGGPVCPSPKKPEPETTNHGETWRRLSLFGALPLIAMLTVVVFTFRTEKERPKFVPYTYLGKREKAYFFKDGKRTLFHNPHWNALPQGYEDEIDEDATAQPEETDKEKKERMKEIEKLRKKWKTMNKKREIQEKKAAEQAEKQAKKEAAIAEKEAKKAAAEAEKEAKLLEKAAKLAEEEAKKEVAFGVDANKEIDRAGKEAKKEAANFTEKNKKEATEKVKKEAEEKAKQAAKNMTR